MDIANSTPRSNSSQSHMGFEELRRIQFLEAADFLIHRENYEDPFYKEFLDLFEENKNTSKEDFEESDHEEEPEDDDGEGKEDDEGEDAEEEDHETPIFLDNVRRDFLQEITSALNEVEYQEAIKETATSGPKEWDEKFGEEDGEKYWRLLENIPFDAPGSFFPLPSTMEEDDERGERKDKAQKEALKKAGLDEDEIFCHESDVRDEIPIDRRTRVYFHKLHSILLDPTKDVSQALRDAFVYRMEKAEYYTSWKVPFYYMSDWTLCNDVQREVFLKAFSIDEQAMKEWRKRLGESRMCHTKSGFYNELDGLRDFIHEQMTLEWVLPDLDSLGLNDENGNVYKECAICSVRLTDDPNDKHRAVQIESEEGKKNYGKCCYDRYLANVEAIGEDATFATQFWDLYNGLAVLDMTPQAIKEGLQLMKKYVDALSTRPNIQVSPTDLEKFASLLRTSATDVADEIAKEEPLAVRQRFTEVSTLGYYVAYDRLQAFADKDVSRYRQVLQTQADVRGLQGVLAFKHKVLDWFREQSEETNITDAEDQPAH